MPGLALTDYMSLAGAVRFQVACAGYGMRSIVGTELAIADPVFGATAAPTPLVVLAENAAGYARLCRLLTDANLGYRSVHANRSKEPVIPFSTLAAEPDGLIVLTGGPQGTLARLLLARHYQEALATAARYRAAFGPDRVFIELQHHCLPESAHLLRVLAELADEAKLRVVATNGVRFARRLDYPVYDLLTCIRLGITVDSPHAARPRNDEAHLKSALEMAALFASLPQGKEALAATNELGARCNLALLKGTCTAPRVPLPAGVSPSEQLQKLCEEGLCRRYATQPQAQEKDSPERRQLAHELEVISKLELEEFFLCVHQIVSAARSLRIRCAGRGSAANSLVAFLLSITGVDPIAHGLLFERFLNPERVGMPDIDIDVQSDRRDELISYVERTYGEQHAAMVANIITYRPRLALRDTAKALGFPMMLVNRMTKVLPHHSDPGELCRYHDQLLELLRREIALDEATRRCCQARLALALQLTARISGLPRHLSLHNGGMVLTRDPLSSLLPVRLSANGVRALEVDKDDVERLGLIKFDLLGLRTLGAIEEALALIEETTGVRPDIDHLPTTPPDPATMRLVRAGQTLAVFQIESPGQWHLLAETQPQTFDDLIVQTALFRPGPLQAQMVHPYITRRQGSQRREQEGSRQRDAVQTPWRDTPADDFWTEHPVLGPILEGSEGILLFQEQILEIAHQFSGLSYAEADGFRRAMSHQRTGDQMEAMHRQFVTGARARGETEADAERVFAAIGHYVGYGFCKSHAAEFARTIYATAWLKAHYPAQYLAAFLSSQPAGFFPPYTVLEEAKLLGLAALPPNVNRSEDRFSVEQVGPPGRKRWAIRIGLRQISGVGEEFARAILWTRRTGSAGGKANSVLYPQYQEHPFRSLQDLCIRLRPQGLTMGIAEALVLSGACDALAPRMGRRQRLWQLRELWPLIHPAHGATTRTRGNGQRQSAASPASAPVEEINQLPLAWEDTLALLPPSELPRLPEIDLEERLALDYQLLGLSAGPHPMRLIRRQLRRQGIQAVTELAGAPSGQVARVAGRVISAARPPTANGMGFLVLEDETGRLPVAVPPQLADGLHQLLLKLREARGLVALGRVERVRWYYSLLAYALWTFPTSEGTAADSFEHSTEDTLL